MIHRSRNFFVGISGWSYPDWNNLVYPSRRPKNFSELELISQLFNVVEINSTYFHPQSVSTSQQWLAQVVRNPHFRFTAKIWQKFVLEKSSDRGTGYAQTDIELTKRGMQPLREAGRLGALLVQFPQSYHYKNENRDWLFRLLDAFQEYPLVVEIRHNSWNRPEILAELNHRGVGFANVDQPQIGQALGFTQVVSGCVAYFRFLGRNEQQWLNKDAGFEARYDYLYSATELDNFVAPIRNALRQTESVYVIFNNHPRAQAVVNALQLQFELMGIKVNVPEKLLQAHPDLARLRSGPNPQQTDLF
ncbi:MAG: DUF72 domain-containing protein [candidate division KSB1 bacterium]|nr:DUF72 domain-containing protein [candidate division KSB1 bacterium]MDZ7303307.1 DUF72 domain-containing protein [candidate division KSB1 bacterium]MDZ7312609.1 DUF72 domain-containing protein [candidate division KSB1 bacterium]